MKRRRVLAGIGAAALAAVGDAAWKFRLFGPHYTPTPYDDLLNQISDRGPASVFGRAALKIMPGVNAARLAAQLRGEGKLKTLAPEDPVLGRVTEVAGWVVPKSVARYAALAASV